MKWIIGFTAGILMCLGTAFAQTPDVVLVLDLTNKTVEVEETIAIRETVNTEIRNISPSAATNLTLRITLGGTTYASASAFTNYGTNNSAIGDVDLNTSEFTNFFAGAISTLRRSFSIAVWDTVLNKLLLNDFVEIQNNPYIEGMPDPSPVGVTYIQQSVTGANWQVSGGNLQLWDTVDELFRDVYFRQGSIVAGHTNAALIGGGPTNFTTPELMGIMLGYAIPNPSHGHIAYYDTGGKWKTKSPDSLTTISWGNIIGTLTNQTDLQAELDDKLEAGDAGTWTNLSGYHDDIGIITNAGVTEITSTDGTVDVTDGTGPTADLSIADTLTGYSTTGDTAVVEADLAAHELLTTGAHSGIVADTDSRLTDARVPLAHNQDWTTITGTPDSVAGYGITNPIIYEGDSRLTDSRDPNPHNQGWGTITGTPDNVAGYGITNDIIYEGDSRLTDARTPLAHDQDWSTITGTPDTISGYGITDAWTKVESDSRFGTTGDVAQVASDLSDHEVATGADVHGLGTMSLQGTGDFYTASATDTLLADKQAANTNLDAWSLVGTGAYYTASATDTLLDDKQAANTNLDAWATVGTGAYYSASATDTLLDGKATTGDMVQAQADIGELQGLTNSTVYTNTPDYTNAVALSGTALQPGAAGTWTNLSGYNNDEGFLTNAVSKPTNTWTAGHVLSSSDSGTTTYATATGAGDFMADGSVLPSATWNFSQQALTNASLLSAGTGTFANVLTVGGSAVLTNEPLWIAASNQVQTDIASAQADIAILQTGKLDVVTAAETYATTGTVGAIDARVSVVETGKLDVVTAATTYATTSTVGAIDGRVSVVETGKLDVVTAASTYATTGTVAGIDGRLSIVETGKLDVVTAASTYATTGTVGAIDGRVSVVETGKLDVVTAAETYATTGTAAAIKTTADGAVQRTGDTNQLVFTGADVRIAAATVSNQPVTKLQLDGKIDVGAAGTTTNLSDYNDDVGYLTNAPVDTVFGETGAITAAYEHYSSFYSLLRHLGTNYAGTNIFTGSGVTRTATGFEFTVGGAAPFDVAPTDSVWGTAGQVVKTDGSSNWYWSADAGAGAGVTNITGTDSSVVVDMTDPAQPDLSVTNYVLTRGFLTDAVSKPTNTWTAGHVLSSSDSGTTTYATAVGAGDFMADGSVLPSATWNFSQQALTNASLLQAGTGTFDNALTVGGSAVLTNEALWIAASNQVQTDIISASTNAEAARQIGTNAQAVADAALPKAGGTVTGNIAMSGSNITDAGTITTTNLTITGLSGNGLVPVGAMMQYIASNAPSGWLVCNGAVLHTNTYAALHGVIGYQYGGSGTNFNLPDLRGVVPLGMGEGFAPTTRHLAMTGGVETVTLTTNQMPTHTHIQNAHDHLETVYGTALGNTGAYSGSETALANYYTAPATAVNQNTGGSQAHENMPPYIVVNYIIKY